jgi:glycine/D-amino acid oxidase-like deaminating enzyme
VVNAAGPWARKLAATAGIDLPVHARRRTVFVLSCPAKLERCPLVIDPTNFWFRPDGDVFIAGDEPADDADDLPLEPDLASFDEALWARMAHRVPAFEALRVQRAWAGYYEMNLFDHNAILGAHPSVPSPATACSTPPPPAAGWRRRSCSAATGRSTSRRSAGSAW